MARDVDVLSAPELVDDTPRAGVHAYEHLRRQSGNTVASPAGARLVDVWRAVVGNKAGLVFASVGDVNMQAAPALTEALREDERVWRRSGARDLRGVEWSAATFAETSVFVPGFAGVRLRALVDATTQARASLPHEAARAIVGGSAAAIAALVGHNLAAGDTFVGFDGVVRVLPALQQVVPVDAQIAAGYAGDRLVVATMAALREVVLVDGDGGGDGDGALLGQIARQLFPKTFEGQRAVDERLALITPERTKTVAVSDDDGRVLFHVERKPVSAAQLATFRQAQGGRPSGVTGTMKRAKRARGPATLVVHEEAERYAASMGGRLPTEQEWARAARGASRRHDADCGAGEYCRVWEWTATRAKSGYVVCGGRHRRGTDRTIGARDWRKSPSMEIGFRCVFDVDADADGNADTG